MQSDVIVICDGKLEDAEQVARIIADYFNIPKEQELSHVYFTNKAITGIQFNIGSFDVPDSIDKRHLLHRDLTIKCDKFIANKLLSVKRYKIVL